MPPASKKKKRRMPPLADNGAIDILSVIPAASDSLTTIPGGGKESLVPSALKESIATISIPVVVPSSLVVPPLPVVSSERAIIAIERKTPFGVSFVLDVPWAFLRFLWRVLFLYAFWIPDVLGYPFSGAGVHRWASDETLAMMFSVSTAGNAGWLPVEPYAMLLPLIAPTWHDAYLRPMWSFAFARWAEAEAMDAIDPAFPLLRLLGVSLSGLAALWFAGEFRSLFLKDALAICAGSVLFAPFSPFIATLLVLWYARPRSFRPTMMSLATGGVTFALWIAWTLSLTLFAATGVYAFTTRSRAPPSLLAIFLCRAVWDPPPPGPAGNFLEWRLVQTGITEEAVAKMFSLTLCVLEGILLCLGVLTPRAFKLVFLIPRLLQWRLSSKTATRVRQR